MLCVHVRSRAARERRGRVLNARFAGAHKHVDFFRAPTALARSAQARMHAKRAWDLKTDSLTMWWWWQSAILIWRAPKGARPCGAAGATQKFEYFYLACAPLGARLCVAPQAPHGKFLARATENS